MSDRPQIRALKQELERLRRQVRELERREREDARKRARFEQLFVNAPQAIVLLDNQDRVVECNPHFHDLFGFLPQEAKGRRLDDLIVPEERLDEGAFLYRQVLDGGVVEAEVIRQHKDGNLIDVSVLGYPIHEDDEQIGIWGIYRDLSRIKRDRLTGLVHKSAFLARVTTELQRSIETDHLVAILLLDIDNFKDVNDTFGLAVGDALLRSVVRRLSATLREIADFGRLGADEFGFLQTGFRDIGSVIGLARRLLAALEEPFQIDDLTLHITASVGAGVSLWRIAGAQELERQAQRALTLAKEAGGDTYQVFTPRLDLATRERVVLGQDLHGSWERQELFLEYQPQISLASSSIVGAEALVRWNHPAQGRLGPDRFIPIAESTGEIVPIGDWVLQAATIQARRWQEDFSRPVTVAVNLSAVQFKDPTLPQRVTQALQRAALEPEHLELEITEGVFVEFNALVDRTLSELEKIGVGLCLDDFGKGYSSLDYLRRLRLRRLKIDRSFVANLSPSGSDAQIVSAISALGSRLGLDVVAEGVETRAQLDFVRAEGCHSVQGYYFSPAVPADKFSELLAEGGGQLRPTAED